MKSYIVCYICSTQTNLFIQHRCRRCNKTGFICKSCVSNDGYERHVADFGGKISGVESWVWSTGYCVDCDKKEIRDEKLKKLGIDN